MVHNCKQDTPNTFIVVHYHWQLKAVPILANSKGRVTIAPPLGPPSLVTRLSPQKR